MIPLPFINPQLFRGCSLPPAFPCWPEAWPRGLVAPPGPARGVPACVPAWLGRLAELEQAAPPSSIHQRLLVGSHWCKVAGSKGELHTAWQGGGTLSDEHPCKQRRSSPSSSGLSLLGNQPLASDLACLSFLRSSLTSCLRPKSCAINVTEAFTRAWLFQLRLGRL